MFFGRLSRLLLLLAPLLLSSTALCQENLASLSGSVTDKTKAVIPGAQVAITSIETSVTIHTKTNRAGEWIVEHLIPGHYRIEISHPGFSATLHEPLELQVSDKKYVDTVLSVGRATETITIQGETPLIDTTASTQGTVVTAEQMAELPSTGVATLLAGITPGAVVSGTVVSGAQAHLFANISDSAITLNGSGSGVRAVNYQLDGAGDTLQNGDVAFVPPIDAVQEFKVTSDAYDASIGRASGGTVSLQFKSGTKSFHGTLFEFNENPTFNARTYNSTAAAPSLHYNEYGGTIGGPIWIPKIYDGRKRRTFFFYTFDGMRQVTPGNSGYMSLPTTLEKQGDYSHSFTTVTSGTAASGTLQTTVYPIRMYDPTTYNSSTGLRSEFAGNNCGVAPFTVKGGIPAGVDPNGYLASRTCRVAVSPIAKAYYAQMPDVSPTANDGSNSDSNNFAKNEPFRDKMATDAIRIDQTWNDNNRSYVTLRYNDWTELGYNPFAYANFLQGLYQQRINRGITLDHNWVVKPSVLLDLRANVTRWEGSSYSPSAGIDPTAYGYQSS